MTKTMTLNVRVSGALGEHVAANVGEDGAYENVSELRGKHSLESWKRESYFGDRAGAYSRLGRLRLEDVGEWKRSGRARPMRTHTRHVDVISHVADS